MIGMNVVKTHGDFKLACSHRGKAGAGNRFQDKRNDIVLSRHLEQLDPNDGTLFATDANPIPSTRHPVTQNRGHAFCFDKIRQAANRPIVRQERCDAIRRISR